MAGSIAFADPCQFLRQLCFLGGTPLAVATEQILHFLLLEEKLTTFLVFSPNRDAWPVTKMNIDIIQLYIHVHVLEYATSRYMYYIYKKSQTSF